MKRTRLILFTAMFTAILAVMSIAPATAQSESLLIWADGERTPILTELGSRLRSRVRGGGRSPTSGLG